MPVSRRLWIGAVFVPLVAWTTPVAVARAETRGPLVYEYSVRGRGNTADLQEFAAAAAATYADPRGWSIGGSVRFRRVASGGDFTLWLAAASQMATFGGVCDARWSCRNGRNVVINEDRWRGASPAWTGAGGSQLDYRHMVVNHETGHWLGFGHSHCASPGATAAVMQQQSLGLQGCLANAWPLSGEREAFSRRLPASLLTVRDQDAIWRDTGNILQA
jgi:Protein of unknown function (DUF3152)